MQSLLADANIRPGRIFRIRNARVCKNQCLAVVELDRERNGFWYYLSDNRGNPTRAGIRSVIRHSNKLSASLFYVGDLQFHRVESGAYRWCLTGFAEVDAAMAHLGNRFDAFLSMASDSVLDEYERIAIMQNRHRQATKIVYRTLQRSVRASIAKAPRPITVQELRDLERVLDAVFQRIGIDVEFTRHFMDRVNDARNKQQITFSELHALFMAVFLKYASKLRQYGDQYEAVLVDINSQINVPFALAWNPKTKMLELHNKTVMRKPNFHTRNRKLVVRSRRNI